ncbi:MULTISPECIES: carbohydrate porin [unclassified Vibrio]|jgi:maltoporin|uniref:carbohydrate porin n=1 Tax=unclassified Vibrio TaxID=2614977 RepID=UPI00159D6900|nr:MULTISPECIES: carbohydrate porin [unclassified Vibrio]NVN80556.1 carbohydrate porin [Vibrio sp. Scap16]QLE95629.1 carbohydrate porin [Vibrio sp. Scap24]
MERSTLTKAILAAGVTSLLSMPAVAEKATSDFEFHGYFRAGAFSSTSNDFAQAMYFGQKETLGRLGLESDDFYELAFMKRWDWADGDSVRIHARLGQNNPVGGVDAQGGMYIDGIDTGLIESYVEIDGISDTGTMWAGMRYYGRDNYIFMTDFFYTDYSGTGIGLQNVKLGGGEWDFAYIASNQSDNGDYDWGDNDSPAGALDYNMLHAAHVRADYGSWRAEVMAKYLADNAFGDDYSTSGIEGHLSYSPGSFFGLGDGFSTTSLQVGQGLGSGTMLGRTFTNYNAFSPGGAGSQGGMTQVKDGDVTARIQAYGGYFAGDWLFFPAVGYETTSYDDTLNGESSSAYWYAMVRPVYTMPSIDNFALASEFGITDQKNNDGDAQYKATIAPTWTMDTGFGPAPELRLTASYVSDSEGQDDVIVGAQVDVWW